MIEVLVAIRMTRWEFRIVPCLAGGNASATCLNMLVIRFADVLLSLLLHFAAQYKFLVIIIFIIQLFKVKQGNVILKPCYYLFTSSEVKTYLFPS